MSVKYVSNPNINSVHTISLQIHTYITPRFKELQIPKKSKPSEKKKTNFPALQKNLLPDNAIFLTDYASEIFISNQNTLILSKKPKIQISLIN